MRFRYLLVFLLVIPGVVASSISLDSNYVSGETLVLKLDLNEKPLTDSFSISLTKDGKRIKVGSIKLKVSNSEYYFYFDIPSGLSGEYLLSVEDILFIRDGKLVEEKAEKVISISTINSGYDWLNNQNIETNVVDNSISLIALDNVGFDVDSSYLLSKKDVSGCFPLNDCKVKETSFALLALNQLGLDSSKTINWLEGAQNDVSKGTYTVKVVSDQEENESCMINGGLGMTKNVDPLKVIKIDCTELSGNVDVELIHTYLGSVNVVASTSMKNSTFVFENNGCFGVRFKGECEYDSSLYASYALKKVGKQNSKAVLYLKDNYDEFRTFDHAMLVLIDNFQYSKDWLVNNKQVGWSDKAITLSNELDVYMTALAIGALGGDSEWIKSQQINGNWGSVFDTAMVLYHVFPEDKLVPVLSFSPAIVRVYENQPPFKINFKNKGFVSISIDLVETESVKPSEDSLVLGVGESDSVFITTDLVDDELKFSYNNITKTILLVKTGISVSEDDIASPIVFLTDESVVFDLRPSEFREGTILFKNNGEIDVSDLQITLTGDLGEIVSLDTTVFNFLAAGDSQELFARVNAERNPLKSSYSGSILITTAENYVASLPFVVNIKGFVEPLVIEEIDVVVDDVVKNDTDVVEEEEEKGSRFIWLVWVVVGVIVVFIVFLIINKRKGKKSKISKNEFSINSFKDYLKRRNL